MNSVFYGEMGVSNEQVPDRVESWDCYHGFRGIIGDHSPSRKSLAQAVLKLSTKTIWGGFFGTPCRKSLGFLVLV